jgi:23S rRNA pseudouridine2457 synthase
MAKLILLNKPFQVLSQFTTNDGKATLADFVSTRGVYPAGRLDFDSEGLLLLTDNGNLQHQIAHPDHKQAKTYLVQVEGNINEEAITHLRKGVILKDGKTLPAKCRKMSDVSVWPRTPPIRERQNQPTSWIELIIREGKNRQVRRMTAAVGFPTLRLIRTRIGDWSLEGLNPGESKTLTIHMPDSLPNKPVRQRGKKQPQSRRSSKETAHSKHKTKQPQHKSAKMRQR